VAVAAMGDPGVAVRLINHVGNAATTLLQKSLPRRLCRLLRAAKGSAKRTMECVICTDDRFTNQCPLLRGPKPSVAYCAASDDNGGFFISRQLMKVA
jgi:hypothetical protein